MLIMVVSLKQISKSEAINLLKNFVLEDRGIDKKIIALIFSLFKFCLVYIKWVDIMDLYMSLVL